ncbi:hypothetical protein COLO4_01699 [Corchorus olitorius]|uniref:Uncharacterized protein n=1 Tax=Corchorus olitorius TaxID=93759 RepID=A0A1R3L246_9ROSI|nr:hypothetical protein COLO4_01699 [Corchorus olitorius]
MVLVGEEALEMLVDEEEVEELRIALLHDHEPRHRGDQVQRQARQPMHAADQRPVARHQQIGNADQAGHDQPDQSFGQGCTGQGQPDHQHPGEPSATRCARPLRQRKAARTDGQEKAHAHVERDDLPEQQIQQRRGQNRRARRRRAPAAIDGQRPCRHQDAAQAEQHRPQACPPGVDAECLERGGGRPVLQRRLFEIFEIVQTRRHPVAGGHHLARDLRIAAFIGPEQGGALEEVVRPQREEHADERDNDQRHPRRAAGRNKAGFHARAAIASTAKLVASVNEGVGPKP